MKKAIEISVLRVSSNGKYIEFVINCPEDYFFTDFTILVYGSNDVYSLKDCLFATTLEEDPEAVQRDPISGDETYYHNKQYYSGQFLVKDINEMEIPEMYEIHLQASYLSSESSDDQDSDTCDNPELDITAEAYISDVSKAYTCLMNDILSMGENVCGDGETTDRVIRNYLILYAHLEAMHLHYLDEARKYFKLLSQCFASCPGNVPLMNGQCGVCGNVGSPAMYPSMFNTFKPARCGCMR